MSLSMYQASVPVFTQALNALAVIFDKAEKHAEAKKIDPAALLQARLYPDMYTLTQQVQVATDTAKRVAGRLAGAELPKYEDNEKSFPEIQARIAKTLAFLATLKPAQIDGSEDRDISVPLGRETRIIKGQAYLLGFGMQNFMFHVATAYDILRHNGVEIGKRDFIGAR